MLIVTPEMICNFECINMIAVEDDLLTCRFTDGTRLETKYDTPEHAEEKFNEILAGYEVGAKIIKL